MCVTDFRELSLLFVRNVRKAPNRGLESSLLPLTRRKSFQTLNEKHISCNACPKYWFAQHVLQKTKTSYEKPACSIRPIDTRCRLFCRPSGSFFFFFFWIFVNSLQNLHVKEWQFASSLSWKNSLNFLSNELMRPTIYLVYRYWRKQIHTSAFKHSSHDINWGSRGTPSCASARNDEVRRQIDRDR